MTEYYYYHYTFFPTTETDEAQPAWEPEVSALIESKQPFPHK